MFEPNWYLQNFQTNLAETEAEKVTRNIIYYLKREDISKVARVLTGPKQAVEAVKKMMSSKRSPISYMTALPSAKLGSNIEKLLSLPSCMR